MTSTDPGSGRLGFERIADFLDVVPAGDLEVADLACGKDFDVGDLEVDDLAWGDDFDVGDF